MKLFGTSVLIIGSLLVLFLLDYAVSNSVDKKGYRKGNNIFYEQYTKKDTQVVPLQDIRRSNYTIIPKVTYDEDGIPEYDNDYDRYYYGSDYTGGSYSGGK